MTAERWNLIQKIGYWSHEVDIAGIGSDRHNFASAQLEEFVSLYNEKFAPKKN